MPGKKFSLGLEEDVLKDLVFLARNAKRLGEIIAAAATIPAGCDFDQTVEHVSRLTKMPTADVHRILQTMHNILRMQGQMRVELPQFLENVTSDLGRAGGGGRGGEGVAGLAGVRSRHSGCAGAPQPRPPVYDLPEGRAPIIIQPVQPLRSQGHHGPAAGLQRGG